MTEKTTPPRRLYRSRRERMIAGVCAGLANYFNTDPAWVRVIFVLFLFFGGCALMIYFILWLVVPLDPGE